MTSMSRRTRAANRRRRRPRRVENDLTDMEWAALTNVVPACGPCNASKCNGEVTSWLRRKGLAEREFLLRHAEIRRTLGPQVATSVPEAAADLLS